MSVALEARVPLLDHRVVELSWRMQQLLKLRNGETKWALRQSLYKRVPKKMIERPKMGFGAPIDQWLRGPLRDWAENLLNESRIKKQNLLDHVQVNRLWSLHLGGENWAYPLWNVLMFQSWLEFNS